MDKVRRGIILKTVIPFFILVVFITAVGVFGFWKLPLYAWMQHGKVRSEIPSSGSYICKELDMAITFGSTTQLFFSDGTVRNVHIDYGCNIVSADQNRGTVRGSYKAYLSKGYVVLSFTELPVAFEEGKDYRFYLQDA